MEKPKLCIVTDAWHPQVNGVVTTLDNIVKQARLDGWEVLVIEPSMFVNFPAPSYPEVRLSLPIRMLRLIKKFKPDHLHVATEGPLGLRARVAYRKKVYTTAYHTSWDDIAKDIIGIPKSWTRNYMRWFHGHGQVMVSTRSVEDYLRHHYIADNIKYLTRGVNLEKLKPDIQRKDRVKPVLLSVGRVSKEKNLDAFCILDHDKYDLRVVGDGPILKDLRAKYPYVTFTGVLKGSELANEYLNADCFVFTSKKDTFGLVMIEAMSMGTPVAAYPVIGPIDVIRDGVTGFCDEDLEVAVQKSLTLDRREIQSIARTYYTWKNTWEQFKNNLVEYAEEYN